MNRSQKFSTLAVGVVSLALSPALVAQAAGPAAPSSPAPAAAAAAPQAIPAKVALIAFEQAVFSTNEGQRAIQDVQKKYEPTKAKIDAASAEVDSLKKQANATGVSEADRAARLRNIDTKEKQLQLDGENASAAYQQDLQEAYGKVAQKFNATMQKYVSDNGFTLLLDVSGQQSSVLFAAPQTDVTRAVIDAYNVASGVAAPPPSAPGAGAPGRTAPASGAGTPGRTAPAPRTTTPRPGTTTPRQ